MNLRSTSLLLTTLPMLALLAGCASSGPVAMSTEYDDVYYASTDRTTSRYAAPAAAPAYDPTAPPAADGSVANPDYNGQVSGGQQSTGGTSYYNGDAYASSPRVTSPYYGSFNQYNSGYAYDPFWSGSSLAIGCGPGWGWGPSAWAYAPIYSGPRVRFGVSFGWGYSSWAQPMYGWAGPTFYNPYYDPFWGSPYGYGGYGYGGYGYGYSPYGYGGGYYQGFYDGYYAGGGGYYGNGPRRRVTYGPRLDRSVTGATASGGRGGTRATRTPDGGGRTVTPGPGTVSGGGYYPASYSAAANNRATRSSTDYAPATGGGQPVYGGNSAGAPTKATRTGRDQAVAAPSYQQPQAQPQVGQAQPEYQQSRYQQPAVRNGRDMSSGAVAAPGKQQYQQQAPAAQPAPMVVPEQPRRSGWFDRATRSTGGESSGTRESSAPVIRSAPSGGFNGGGGSRSSGGGGGGGGGGARRSR
jgi:hypothetical protein